MTGRKTIVAPKSTPYERPRALSTAEVSGIVDEYREAARNAHTAGFDGVEIHGANGYLPDQFLHASSNIRTDRYGGSIRARTNFLVEIAEAVADELGADRMGLRISPSSTYADMMDPESPELYGLLLERLAHLNPSYLHVVEPGIAGKSTVEGGWQLGSDWVRQRWNHPIIATGGYDLARAERTLANGTANAVGFARPFVANPDLLRRMVDRVEIVEAPREIYYGGGPAGYVDFPSSSAASVEPALDHSATAALLKPALHAATTRSENEVDPL